MVRKLVLECSFLIPIRRDRNLSDGKLHKTDAWDWLKGELYRRFEGLTQAPELYAGSYKDPDTEERVSDESYKYFVAVPKNRVRQLRRLLAEACLVFHQKSIYLSVAGYVEFVEAKAT